MADKQRTVVVVDDEEALVWSLSTQLIRARPRWEIRTATTGDAALKRIRTGPADLLVADVRMPGMSGIDLILTARQEYPQLPVVMMTAHRTADVQRLGTGPFTSFIEKPFQFDRLLTVIDEALSPPLVGFSGTILVQTLPDIVQLYILSTTTGMMSIRRDGAESFVWFERGTVVHAVCPGLVGDEAFHEIMTWPSGDFRMHLGGRTTERSIITGWQNLLIESCRRIDERGRHDARPPAGKWTLSPPPQHETDFEAAFDAFVETTIPIHLPSTTTDAILRRDVVVSKGHEATPKREPPSIVGSAMDSAGQLTAKGYADLLQSLRQTVRETIADHLATLEKAILARVEMTIREHLASPKPEAHIPPGGSEPIVRGESAITQRESGTTRVCAEAHVEEGLDRSAKEGSAA